jgi:predicted Zn-ribbon and HTH transcriptional regulator
MPNYTWHDGKKIHDFDTSNFLGTNRDRFCDWEIVTLFYSALHYIDSYLSNKFGIDYVLDHGERKTHVASLLPQINRNYRLLYYLSRDARYNLAVGKIELAKATSYYGQIRHVLTPVSCPKCGFQNLKNIGKCEICHSTI